MKGNIEERAILLAHYMIDHQSTVRAAARKFGVSKSTVHADLTIRLRQLNEQLFIEAGKVLQKNKQERHIRGGRATQQKYRQKKSAASSPFTKQPTDPFA